MAGEHLCVPTAMTAKLGAVSALLFLSPSSSMCCMDCSGLGKKWGKFLWVVPFGCSRLATSYFQTVGRMVLFLVVCHCRCCCFLPSWAKLTIFIFSPAVLRKRWSALREGHCSHAALFVIVKKLEMCYTELAEKCRGGCCCFYANTALCPMHQPR